MISVLKQYKNIIVDIVLLSEIRVIMLRQCVTVKAFLQQRCVSFKPIRKRSDEIQSSYDAIVIGGGHNGLVAAAYLQKSGLNVCVLERRHVIGGAAVTEEIISGFKFSRASYVLSLLRPQIINDLELKKHGLKLYMREPSSYTPVLDRSSKKKPKSLTLGSNVMENCKQIGQFSTADAKAFITYEEKLNRIVAALNPLLDVAPINLHSWLESNVSMRKKWQNWPSLKAFLTCGKSLGVDLISFYEFLTSPAEKILNGWFESEPLKATLATDAVIGANLSPKMSGSGYVLLHHVMGEIDGKKGMWAYVEGGMGAVSESIARVAKSHGSSIFTNKKVKKIVVNGAREVCGVGLEDGTEIRSKLVLSNATPKVTFIDLLDKNVLPSKFRGSIESIDYTSIVTKINVAVNSLPNFLADSNTRGKESMPHHRATIHINSEHMGMLHSAYMDAVNGRCSDKPVIEMTIPSSVDPTVAPPGCHVVQLFTQYTPYKLADGDWTEEKKNAYADKLFDDIEEYAPGFKSSIIGSDILTPPDLERVFGLTGGNIFHGALALDQLYFFRPLPRYSNYETPISGLFLCGSGAHPGGGVMGSPGRLAALSALEKLKRC